MDVLTWIIVGLVAGLLASLVMGGIGYGILGDIIIGILGALFGGWLFARMGWSFFFSSRRRHTRSLRDWSSDVCSSDLELAGPRARAGDGDHPEGGHPERV